MKAAKVCQLHKTFQREWRRDFPKDPFPVLKDIDSISKDEPIEEGVTSFILAVKERLVTIDSNINIFREQIRRELVVKQFLIHVLEILDTSEDFSVQLSAVCSQLSDINSWNLSASSVTESNNVLHTICAIESTSESNINDSGSPKFISKFGENKVTNLSSTSPRLCYSSFKKKDLNNDNNHVYDHVDGCSEYEEMFKRKRSNFTKAHQGDIGVHNLGSKDNFPAVGSKHATAAIPRQVGAEGISNSPRLLHRNFQLLKLTDNFDLVLGDKDNTADDNRSSNGERKHSDCDTSRGDDNIFHSNNIKNRKSNDSFDVTPTEANGENISTIQIRKPGLRGHEPDSKACVVESGVNQAKQTLVQESSVVGCQQQTSISGGSNRNSIHLDSCESVHSFEDRQEYSFSFQNSLRKFSNRGAVVPPPVAKKPSRAGSDKKSPTCPVEETASVTAKETSCIIRTCDNLANTQPGLLDFSKRSDCVFNRSHSTDGIAGEDQTFQSATSNPVKITSRGHPPPLQLNEPGANLICTDSTAVTNVLEVAKERRVVSDTEMSFYKFNKDLDDSNRNSIGELVEGIGYNLINIHQRQVEECNTGIKDDNSNTSSDISSPPDIPCKMPINMHNESSATLCETENVTNEESVDCHIFVNSASTDDIDLDCEENVSFFAGVKDITNQESVNEDTTMNNSPKAKKRLSSTPNYENWTINRAITSSNRDFYSVSDDDELDEISSSPIAASPYIDQHDFSKGSKDSGLCDDISASEISHADVHSGSDIANGQVQVHRTILQVEHRVKDGVQPSRERVYLETDIYNEVSSENVFVPEPDEIPHRHENDITESISADLLSVDALSVASDGDEEASTNMDSSYDETDSAREGMLKMRQLLVKGVLDSEKGYLGILTLLIDYKRSLEACSMSSQPVISREDIQTIFSNIEVVKKIHTEFVNSLEAKVMNWNQDESIGEIFKIMIFKLNEFGNYLNNYQKAISTIHKCYQESEKFAEIAKHITVNSTMKEVTSLEDALFKPVQRVQRNTLVLHDLIKYTPEDHPDYLALKKALRLSQILIENFAAAIPQNTNTQENRRLVKSSFLVENVGGVRKLRYIFLFSDVLVCTKRETHRNNKVSFDIKWFAPLSHTGIDTKFSYTDDNKISKKDDINELKSRLKGQKRELKAETRKSDERDKHRSLVSLGGGGTRNVEKLKKKVNQTEAQLILASPKLPFKVLIEGGKSYTLLMSTDYEREEWKETVISLCKMCSRADQTSQHMSSIYIQELVNSVKETPQVNKIGNVLSQKDEDMLTGILNVTIHKVNGLTEACDTYCIMEMDSFGHFFFKARTTLCENSRDPAWNEDFDLELEGSETLRVLCFKREPQGLGDTLLGRGALELNKQWLKDSFQEKTLSMNEISLIISVRHIPADKTMQRTPSRTSSALFGVSISVCAKRERKTVPTIVTACVQEVEKRGLDEVGIYRVSGVSSDLQSMKRLFDKNVRASVVVLQDADIHSVTGVLKLYLRELPEPLFTEANYQSFIDTLKLSDEEAKTQCMLALLHGLPDTNYYTIVYLLEHLIKVAKMVGENKMSIQNLSTIFGPTLLAPASKQVSKDPLEMMCKGAEEVMQQSSVINFLLGLAISGKSLRRSAQ